MNKQKHQLLAHVADMYFNQNLTQEAIAKALDVSRVKIYRLLKEAKEKQVVRISIDWPSRRNQSLEAELERFFNLDTALVLAASDDLPATAQLAAEYLEANLLAGTTLSVCLGKTTHAVIDAIHGEYQMNIKVAQATGGMPATLQQYDSAALARRLANKLGGEAIYLPSPAIADSKEAAKIISEQSEVKKALEASRQADFALVGIGHLDASSNFISSGFLTKKDVLELKKQGAVGDMAWRIFDSQGELVKNAFNDRVIGISLDDLKRIRHSIAVAIGKDRVRAIYAALNTGTLNTLITDEKTSKLLLEQKKGRI